MSQLSDSPKSVFLDLPPRVVVGANGAYWRDYTDDPVYRCYSMCPVSTDNDPVEPVAVYVRVPMTAEGEQQLDAALAAYNRDAKSEEAATTE